MDLDEIKKRRLTEYLQRFQDPAEKEQQDEDARQQISAMDVFVKQRLSKDALSRYGNIKTAHPELWLNVLAMLFQAMQQNNVSIIEDDQLRDLLMRLQQPKADFHIRKD
ncbi:hypothetical protein JW968_04215 [Candidatus Woesearchaeota archaeon]|nr:hypothetical protein [Candidatus Woesearchaeota archaeon]